LALVAPQQTAPVQSNTDFTGSGHSVRCQSGAQSTSAKSFIQTTEMHPRICSPLRQFRAQWNHQPISRNRSHVHANQNLGSPVPRSLVPWFTNSQLPLSPFVWMSLRRSPITAYLYRYLPLQLTIRRVFGLRELWGGGYPPLSCTGSGAHQLRAPYNMRHSPDLGALPWLPFFGAPPGFHSGWKSLPASHRTGSISDWIARVMKPMSR
jgi:hypothetical protein